MNQIYRTKKTFLLILTIFILVSCGPRLVYPHLNWLIPWYISDYISLDSSQKNMLQKRLLKQLDWHCRTQLPAYAELLRSIGRDFANADQALTYSKIQFYHKKLEKLWKELMTQIGPDLNDIISTASDAQIAELFDNLSAQNQEFKEKYVDPPIQQLNEKRRKRVIDRLGDWISDLTTEQKTAVATWSGQLLPLAEDWLENREKIQAEARRLLSQRNNTPEFRAKLLQLIVNPEQMRSPSYQAKIDINTDITYKFILQLNRMLTSRQRSYLLKRIESLAADFDKLSCDPKEIPKVQGSKRNSR